MVSIDLSLAQKYADQDVLQSSKEKAATAFRQVQDKSGKGSEWLGWRDLVSSPNDALISEISQLATEIREDADVFIVCGIGGSYLGAKAAIDALKLPFYSDRPRIVYAGHQISGQYLEQLIEYISKPRADGEKKSVYINVISKSGTTMETALAFRTLSDWMFDTYGEKEASKRIVCTTSAEGGKLNELIDRFNYKKFIIPDDVGGRYSVLTPVGLLPIAVAGIDIRSMYYGAVDAYQKYEKNPSDITDYAATRIALYQNGFNVDVMASFEPNLSAVCGWMQQLFGESEGKNGKGIFPAIANYSTDLHSIGQFVQDGTRNLMETFLTVKEASTPITVVNQDGNVDGLNYLTGKSFHHVNEKAFEGTRQAHDDGGVPIVTIEAQKLSPETVGWLFYMFELACAVYVYSLDENPFDQPGVEAYKKAMFRLLGKPE